MKRDSINYVVVGAFVLAVGAAFLVLMYAITGRAGPSDTYYAYYRNVSGVKFGTGVFYEGYRVGQVEGITPESDADGQRFEVELSIVEDWPIPADSVARIVAGGLISAITIEISAGESSTLIQPEAEIPSEEQSNLFVALNEAASGLSELSVSGLTPLLNKLEESVDALTREYVALRREDLSPLVQMLHQNSEQLLANANDSMARIQALLNDSNIETVDSLLASASSAAGGFSSLVGRLDETRAVLHDTMTELNGVVVDSRGDIQASVSNLQEALASLNVVLATVEAGIESIVYHLEGTAQNAHEFARGIRSNPASLLRGTDANEVATP